MAVITTEVCKILEINPHPNADSLELATVKGWQTCIKKDTYKVGDLVVYFEPASCLPEAMAKKIGVVDYLRDRLTINGDRALVVGQIKLRGEASFGLVIPAEPQMQEGDDVAEYYGVTKYEPPVTNKINGGDMESDSILFPRYSSPENLRSNPRIFTDGEEIVVTEKIHGTSCRVGYIWDDETNAPILKAGSKGFARRKPEDLYSNTYWFPHTYEGIQNLLTACSNTGVNQVIIYGEVYGPKIQNYTYGEPCQKFRAFDILIDGNYLRADNFTAICDLYKIPTVPLMYRGEYSLQKIKELSDGDSLIGGTHGREGVVVKPIVERTDRKVGRVCMKYIGDNYLLGKSHAQDTTDV